MSINNVRNYLAAVLQFSRLVQLQKTLWFPSCFLQLNQKLKLQHSSQLISNILDAHTVLEQQSDPAEK